ncbi:hypothetical protein [Actinomadura sp. 9N215]|uniref:hypothetical protein n=1 Tax=Actinomadura sp. 9N215 TaxID=3375150 RepID=UPI0037B1ABC3
MATGLFTSAALRLNPSNLYEIQDGSSGTVLARLVEVARLRSPRGNVLTADRVQTPRLTFAVTAPDGTTLLYFDRAEHLKLSPVAPQSAFIAPDGTLLARVEYDSHSTFQGGGRILGTTEQGMNLTPAARLLDANLRPLGDLICEQPPDLERPTLPNGIDARVFRWTTPDGTQLAERRDGVLYLDARATGAWRPVIFASYLALAFEFHLPFGDGQATESGPEIYPGYAGIHAAYNEYQANFMAEYRAPARVAFGQKQFRAGVQRDQLDHLLKIFGPIAGIAAVILLIIKLLT